MIRWRRPQTGDGGQRVTFSYFDMLSNRSPVEERIMLTLLLWGVILYIVYLIVMAFYHWILRVSERNTAASRRRAAASAKPPQGQG